MSGARADYADAGPSDDRSDCRPDVRSDSRTDPRCQANAAVYERLTR